MHLVNYNPTTNQVLGYIDPSMGFHGTDDGWVINEELKQNALKVCKKAAKESINNSVIAIYTKLRCC